MMERIRATLDALPRATSTAGSLERALHEGDPSPIERALERLRERRARLRVRGRAVAAHDRRSATTRTACSCARPATPTYFAADVAYHEDKLERGFDRLINVARRRPPRLRRAHEGGDGGARRGPGPARDPDPAVRAHRRGRRARVDVQAPRRVRHARRADRRDRRRRRRAGSCSSARTTRRSTSTSTSRAQESAENPVYYVQYAHARIASMLRKAGDGARGGGARRAPATGCALEPAERELIKQLLAFPAEVAEAAERRAPHRIATYALELGADVHRLLPRLPRGRRRAARRSSRSGSRCASRRSGTIARALDLLGVSAPELDVAA